MTLNFVCDTHTVCVNLKVIIYWYIEIRDEYRIAIHRLKKNISLDVFSLEDSESWTTLSESKQRERLERLKVTKTTKHPALIDNVPQIIT